MKKMMINKKIKLKLMANILKIRNRKNKEKIKKIRRKMKKFHKLKLIKKTQRRIISKNLKIKQMKQNWIRKFPSNQTIQISKIKLKQLNKILRMKLKNLTINKKLFKSNKRNL